MPVQLKAFHWLPPGLPKKAGYLPAHVADGCMAFDKWCNSSEFCVPSKKCQARWPSDCFCHPSHWTSFASSPWTPANSRPPEAEVDVEVVVAHCTKELSWLAPLEKELSLVSMKLERITIYSKCGKSPQAEILGKLAKVHELSNHGRNDHSFLHHIYSHYEDLRRVVLFLKDSTLLRPFKSPSLTRVINMAIAAFRQGFACYLPPDIGGSSWHAGRILRTFHMKVYNKKHDQTRVTQPGRKLGHKKKPRTPSFENAKYRNMGDWLSHVVPTFAETHAGNVIWPACYGGTFASTRDRIGAIPVTDWRNLKMSLVRADNLVEGHYMERAWAPLLTLPSQSREWDRLLDGALVSTDPGERDILHANYHGMLAHCSCVKGHRSNGVRDAKLVSQGASAIDVEHDEAPSLTSRRSPRSNVKGHLIISSLGRPSIFPTVLQNLRHFRHGWSCTACAPAKIGSGMHASLRRRGCTLLVRQGWGWASLVNLTSNILAGNSKPVFLLLDDVVLPSHSFNLSHLWDLMSTHRLDIISPTVINSHATDLWPTFGTSCRSCVRRTDAVETFATLYSPRAWHCLTSLFDGSILRTHRLAQGYGYDKCLITACHHKNVTRYGIALGQVIRHGVISQDHVSPSIFRELNRSTKEMFDQGSRLNETRMTMHIAKRQREVMEEYVARKTSYSCVRRLSDNSHMWDISSAHVVDY
ncbi:hypothetical protein AB1Y20_022637 [Prymnesium parvum]|uniref:Protein xylosyltransferase n=1 Tax=Prymnesium parvum TaxID=97485 RepID=A0AB34JJE9_PRYPA